MSERLEVLAGLGTVIRVGRVTVWAGPHASPALLTFLNQSVRNVGISDRGGRQLVDHVAAILANRDPEPSAPFAAVGPDGDGWVALLHGPVQLWDGVRWLAPAPSPGWLQSALAPQPAVSVGPAGAPAPRLYHGSPFDLRDGMVPGGGFLLVPDSTGAAPRVAAAAQPDPFARPSEPTAPTRPPTPPAAAAPPPAAAAPPPDTPASVPPLAPPKPGELVDLGGSGLTATRPPLAAVTAADDGRYASQPLVSGIRCPAGHFDHPRAKRCARCGAELAGRPVVTGPRPPLGVLIADDGTVYRVDGDLVCGSDPDSDPGVVSGRAAAVRLVGANASVAPVHAEIRVVEWAVSVTDRGSSAGTHLVHPGQSGWQRLEPYQAEALLPGSHVAVGQRVLTYVSPWPAGDEPG